MIHFSSTPSLPSPAERKLCVYLRRLPPTSPMTDEDTRKHVGSERCLVSSAAANVAVDACDNEAEAHVKKKL